MCKRNPYSFNGIPVTSNKTVELDPNCNGITVINRGDSTLTFNGIPLLPSTVPGQTGEQLSIGGNANEILNNRIDLHFTGGTINKAIVIQKFYTCG